MGVVYKAEDTTLERTVALKFLAQHLLDDDEAKARFLREAKAAAALDHPNICTVYEIAEADGKTFIAMAYLEGESLEEHITKGPLSLKDALDFARQTADGLQAAHTKGVFHRDIKPANIIVSPEGRATIMDFGLARLTEASRLTKLDTAMGTVAYMSPEQAQGMEVDSRTDVWALGCVLYEMVSGQRPFQGQYDQALLYEIVHQEPAALTGLRTGVPVELELLATKCLAKDAENRYQAAKEVAVDLRALAEKLKSGRSTILRTTNVTGAVPAEAGEQTLHPVVPPPPTNSARAWQPLFAISMLAFLGSLFVNLAQSPPNQPTRRFSFVPPHSIDTNRFNAGLALSPDGMRIAYTTHGTSGGLWVQDLDQDEPRQLAGTEGALLPFWSPDSKFIAYITGAELRKISVNGGSGGLICSLPSPISLQGTWSPDGESIVFASVSGSGGTLYMTSLEDGSPEVLVAADEFSGMGSGGALRPRFVPGASDRILLFTAGTGSSVELHVKNLDSGQTAALGPGSGAVYSAATGHLVYESATEGYDLWTRPFSHQTLQFTGPALSLRQDAREPSVADDGTLAYLDATTSAAQTVVWVSRTGEFLEVVGQPQQDIAQLSLSPDGQRVAVRSLESGNHDVWLQDLTRSTKTRLTFDDRTESNPTWSPSGREIAYRLEGVPNRIMLRNADGTGEAVALAEGRGTLFYLDWSVDGRYLVYIEANPETRSDIRYIELGTDSEAGEPITFLGSPADEQSPKFSHDGRFLAYASDESGSYEIYVRPFPGGTSPRWRSDGREMYYLERGTLMAISVSGESAPTLGQPQPLFEALGLTMTGAGPGGYDVSADGQRFLTVAPVEGADAAPPKIRLVQNWYEEFRDRE